MLKYGGNIVFILVCVPRRINPWDEWQAFRGVQCTQILVGEIKRERKFEYSGEGICEMQ